jgi:hypothetical protein
MGSVFHPTTEVATALLARSVPGLFLGVVVAAEEAKGDDGIWQRRTIEKSGEGDALRP